MANKDNIYSVVVNHEEQYSIWPAGKGIPSGWKAQGTSGTQKECLAFIEKMGKQLVDLRG